MEPEYAALDEEGQVEVLRHVALAAADGFGLVVRDLALVLHAFNTTFRVDTDDGRRLALRVNTNSMSTPAHIAAQQAWLHALATETDVRVPDPLAAGVASTFSRCPIPTAQLHSCASVGSRYLLPSFPLSHSQNAFASSQFTFTAGWSLV